MVAARVRSRRCRTSHRMPSATSGDSRDGGRGSGAPTVRIVVSGTAARANVTAFTPNGSAAPTTNSQAPTGFAVNWFRTVKAAYIQALARGRPGGGTRVGTKAAAAVSARV